MNLSSKIASVIKERKQEAKPALRNLGDAQIEPTRNSFFKWVYATGLIEASAYSAHLSDKLFFSRLVEEILPESRMVPRARMISEMGATPEDRRKIFPNGYVVKLAGDQASEGRGMYLNGEDFFSESPPLPEGEVVNPISGLVSSGELYFAQEKLGAREKEYRLHTLEGEVIKNATFTRWDHDWDLDAFARAELALQEFLSSLPAWATAKQAWGVDLMERSDGTFGIVEVNTNRGRPKSWSGDLPNPDVLQAYVLHLEARYGACFLGESGELFRTGKAGQKKYEEKFDLAARQKHAELKARFRRQHGNK